MGWAIQLLVCTKKKKQSYDISMILVCNCFYLFTGSCFLILIFWDITHRVVIFDFNNWSQILSITKKILLLSLICCLQSFSLLCSWNINELKCKHFLHNNKCQNVVSLFCTESLKDGALQNFLTVRMQCERPFGTMREERCPQKIKKTNIKLLIHQ